MFIGREFGYQSKLTDLRASPAELKHCGKGRVVEHLEWLRYVLAVDAREPDEKERARDAYHADQMEYLAPSVPTLALIRPDADERCNRGSEDLRDEQNRCRARRRELHYLLKEHDAVGIPHPHYRHDVQDMARPEGDALKHGEVLAAVRHFLHCSSIETSK